MERSDGDGWKGIMPPTVIPLIPLILLILLIPLVLLIPLRGTPCRHPRAGSRPCAQGGGTAVWHTLGDHPDSVLDFNYNVFNVFNLFNLSKGGEMSNLAAGAMLPDSV